MVTSLRPDFPPWSDYVPAEPFPSAKRRNQGIADFVRERGELGLFWTAKKQRERHKAIADFVRESKLGLFWTAKKQRERHKASRTSSARASSDEGDGLCRNLEIVSQECVWPQVNPFGAGSRHQIHDRCRIRGSSALHACRRIDRPPPGKGSP